MKFIKRHRVLSAFIALVIATPLVLLILHANNMIFLTPLRSRPDEILVYKYGEAVRLTPKDEAFKEIYKGLKSYGIGSPTQRIQARSYDVVKMWSDSPFYDGIAVRCIYNKTQMLIGVGSNFALFNEITFSFYEWSDDWNIEKMNRQISVHYTDLPYDSYTFNGNIGDYKYPWDVEEYIKSLDISGFPSAKDFPLPYRMRTGR